MYKRVAAILFPITLVALVGAAAWGYQEYQDKNAILIKAENSYQRAFHDFNEHLERLQGELGKSLAMNSPKQMAASMTNVWRLAYSAQNDIGQLPLTLVPFDQAEKYLSKVGRFAYNVGVRDFHKEPLTEKERKTLETLYEQARNINREMQTVQHRVLDKNLRWMDVELAIATEDKKMDNTIIDGFKTVNQKVQEFPEVDWGPTVNNMEVRNRERAKNISGKKISLEQAKQIVAKAFGKESTRGMKAEHNKNGEYETISVRYTGAGNTAVQTELTAKGGHIVWMVFDRPVKKKQLHLNQALQKADRFLERIGYKDMEPIAYDETANIVSYTFVHRVNGVSVYPQTLAVKVALDNGEIMGLQADEYVFNNFPLSKTKPELTLEEARKKLSPRLEVQKSGLAIIYNQAGQPVLCYEFMGTIKGTQYRVFINANNGDEEYIDRIEKADADQI
ncbi:MAG: germination protein YpeB [Thermoactinomyces sp.]